jgi:hypothetical protein
MRSAYTVLDSFESFTSDLRALVRASLTDDFLYHDRRSLPILPVADAELFLEVVGSIWETGVGRPRLAVPEIVAVRGEDLVAGRIELDYGNGMITESVEVMLLDGSLKLLRRAADFDVDDIGAAVDELDRLHRATDRRWPRRQT